MLEFKNVTKVYESNKGIRNCSWSIHDHEVVGILGNNGCGKTTTFKVILGLEDYEGEILYNNQRIDTYPKYIFGYVPEERTLYSDAYIYDLLVMMARLHGIDKKNIESKLDELLSEFHLYSYKYKKVYELSKGNQQVLQIICAILHNPKILILDEPFNGLDQHKVNHLIRYLKKRNGITLLSFHQSQLISKVCDKVIYMKDGYVDEIIEVHHE